MLSETGQISRALLQRIFSEPKMEIDDTYVLNIPNFTSKFYTFVRGR